MWEVDNVEETVHIVADWKVESNQNCDGKRINCSFVIYITWNLVSICSVVRCDDNCMDQQWVIAPRPPLYDSTCDDIHWKKMAAIHRLIDRIMGNQKKDADDKNEHVNVESPKVTVNQIGAVEQPTEPPLSAENRQEQPVCLTEKRPTPCKSPATVTNAVKSPEKKEANVQPISAVHEDESSQQISNAKLQPEAKETLASRNSIEVLPAADNQQEELIPPNATNVPLMSIEQMPAAGAEEKTDSSANTSVAAAISSAVVIAPLRAGPSNTDAKQVPSPKKDQQPAVTQNSSALKRGASVPSDNVDNQSVSSTKNSQTSPIRLATPSISKLFKKDGKTYVTLNIAGSKMSTGAPAVQQTTTEPSSTITTASSVPQPSANNSSRTQHIVVDRIASSRPPVLSALPSSDVRSAISIAAPSMVQTRPQQQAAVDPRLAAAPFQLPDQQQLNAIMQSLCDISGRMELLTQRVDKIISNPDQ